MNDNLAIHGVESDQSKVPPGRKPRGTIPIWVKFFSDGKWHVLKRYRTEEAARQAFKVFTKEKSAFIQYSITDPNLKKEGQ